MDWNRIQRILKDIVEKGRRAVGYDGTMTIVATILWLLWFVLTKKDVLMIGTSLALAAGGVLVILARWQQVKFRTRGAAARHNVAKEWSVLANKWGLWAGIIAYVIIVFRHFLLHGPTVTVGFFLATVVAIMIGRMFLVTGGTNQT